MTQGSWTLEQLSPGMLVIGRVIRRDTSHALVRFLDVFDGILEWFHLDAWADFKRLQVGAELRVRILYVDMARRHIALSARKSIVDGLEPPLKISTARQYYRGLFVEQLQVIRVDRTKGIWFQKQDEEVLFFADRHALSDDRSGRIEHLFPPGKVLPRARVLSHMAIEGVVRVTLRPSLLQRKFLDHAELAPGDLVRCTVVGWETNTINGNEGETKAVLLVDVEGCLPGRIPLELLTDVPVRLRHLQKRYPNGSSMRCRVWESRPKKKQVVLTARKSLVESSLPVLASWDHVQIGQIVHGLVTGRDQAGSYRLLFYQRVEGILSSSPATEAASLVPGQVIRVRVQRVLEQRRKQVIVRLASEPSMAVSDELALSNGAQVRIQRAYLDQVGRVLAVVEPLEPAHTASDAKTISSLVAVLPMHHLTDYAMLQEHWASKAGLQALTGELAIVLDSGKEAGSMPVISHRWTILRAAQLRLLPNTVPDRMKEGDTGLGLVQTIEPTLTYMVMRLGLSRRRVRVERRLLADRFVESSTQVLEPGQLVFYHVQRERRFSLRYRDVATALQAEPFRELYQEMRSFSRLAHELLRLWQERGPLQSPSMIPPLPGSLVRARVLRITAEMMEVDVQHEQIPYRGMINPYHFPEEEHVEAEWKDSATGTASVSSAGQLFTALVLWSDPLGDQLVLSRRSAFLKTAPWRWIGQQDQPPTCLRAQILAIYGNVAVLWSPSGLAFMSTMEINGRAQERPYFLGQELDVVTDARMTAAAAEQLPDWIGALARASVRPATSNDLTDHECTESSTGSMPRCRAPVPKVGSYVTTARVAAVHPFQVHVRWANGHTGRVHITNVDDEETFLRLKVAEPLPRARIVGQRSTRRQWELSLRQHDLEATSIPQGHPNMRVGDLIDVAVIKTTERGADGLVRNVRLYIRPGLVACLTRLEATPRTPDDSWTPGRFVRQLRLLRIDPSRQRYYLTTTERMVAGQRITGARIRSLHPADGLIRVQLPRGLLGQLFVGQTDVAASTYPFQLLRVAQNLDVYLLCDLDECSLDQVPVTAMQERSPLVWGQLRPGDIVDAFIRRVDSAGVFVNLAPGLVARCLLRDLAVGFVQDPAVAFPVGMHVRAMVVECGANERQIRVSFRAALEASPAGDPSVTAVQVGTVYLGRVRNVVPFGIFLDLLDTPMAAVGARVLATGLCHRSELVDEEPWPAPDDLPQRFHIGQQVPVLVAAVDPAGRLSLTIKPTRVSEALAKQAIADESRMDEKTTPAAPAVSVAIHQTEEEAIQTRWNKRSTPNEHDVFSTDSDDDEGTDDAGTSAAGVATTQDNAATNKHPRRTLSEQLASVRRIAQEPMMNQAPFMTSKQIVSTEETKPFLVVPNDDNDNDGDQRRAGSPAFLQRSGGAPTFADPLSGGPYFHDDSDDDDTLEQGERELVEALDKPQTAADYERLLLGRPNDARLWIAYMALHLANGQLPEARAIAERALQTIHFREQAARLRLWIAYLNLERHANPSTDPLDNDVFRRALENCDSEQLHLRFASALEAAQEPALAMRVYERACQRHGHRLVSVWTCYGAFCFLRSSQAALGRSLLERALRTLAEPAQHIQCILKFAIFEFRGCGDPERGRTLLESLIQAFPKRLDFWNVYIDMETVLLRQGRGNLEFARRVLGRCTALSNLSLKQAKHFFKRYIELERAFGDEASVQAVKDAARSYVAQRTV
jgi:ribosomal protein S1/tetratricopeptide (TPR) repeat protein